jgi:hypothetical protein
VRARLSGNAPAQLSGVPVRVTPKQPLHPLALLRQSRSRQTRLFSTAVRRLASLTKTTTSRTAFPASATGSALRTSPFSAFSSPLRPNLTGGALPRSAGGYGLGSGGMRAARHFSHTAGAQAQVVHNVNAGIRAFFVQGKTAVYAGTDTRTGEIRFRSVGSAEARTLKASEQAHCGVANRGTSLDFHIAPAVTAVSAQSVLDETVLHGLAADFARQLRDLAAVRADLKRLSALGTLPVSKPDPTTIRVRFPGCDAEIVEALCDEVGVTRGIVREDAGWNEGADANETSRRDSAEMNADKDVEMALLFPLAPTTGLDSGSEAASDVEAYFEPLARRPQKPTTWKRDGLEWHSMLSSPLPSSSPSAHLHSEHSELIPPPPSHDTVISAPQSFSYVDSPFTFESLNASEAASEYDDEGPELSRNRTLTQTYPDDAQQYQGVEGIYRFLREIERVEGRVRASCD